MARAEANWERLVRAALRGERLVGAYGQPVTGIAGNVPSSLGNNVHIEEVLRAADEIQDEDPTVARIRKSRYHFCPAELGSSACPTARSYGFGYRSCLLLTSCPSLVLVAVRLLRYSGSLVFGITLDNYASLQTWSLVSRY
jgi:callose synthase